MLRQTRIVRSCAITAGCALLAAVSLLGSPPQHALAATAVVWVCCLLTGVHAKGAAPFPNGWWVLLAAGCVVRIGVGLLLHARYDRPAWRSFVAAPLYALGYWFALAAVTVRSTLPVLLGRWSPARERLGVPDRTLRIAAPPSADG